MFMRPPWRRFTPKTISSTRVVNMTTLQQQPSTGNCDLLRAIEFRKSSFLIFTNILRVKCIANISWRGKNEQPTTYLRDRDSRRRSAGYRQQRNRITRKWSQIDHKHSVHHAALRQADLNNLPSRVFNGVLNAVRDRESFTFDYLFFFFERGGFAMEFSILSVKFVPYFSEVFSRKSCCETNVTLKNNTKTFISSSELTFSFRIRIQNHLTNVI